MLSLLPANPQPFALGPRDYLHQFMTLLSILRSGDNRFLPLLLSKVHEVLPTLTSPMLQTVPDNAPAMCEVDIFGGYGPIMAGSMSSSSHSTPYGLPTSLGPSPDAFKLPNNVGFKMESQNLGYEKRVELNSPDTGDSSPFTSPPVLGSQLEFPGMGDYAYPVHNVHGSSTGHNLPSTNIGSFVEGQPNFKREFEGNMGLVGVPSSAGITAMRRPPIRQNSGSSYGSGMQQMPRSVPEYGQHSLQRTNSGGVQEMGIVGDHGRSGEMPFR